MKLIPRKMTVHQLWRSPCWVSGSSPESLLKPVTHNADHHGRVVDQETQAKGATDTPEPCAPGTAQWALLRGLSGERREEVGERGLVERDAPALAVKERVSERLLARLHLEDLFLNCACRASTFLSAADKAMDEDRLVLPDPMPLRRGLNQCSPLDRG